MSAYFVTSSGTEIGKTFVTCTLIRQLRALGKQVAAIKPVISGYDAANPTQSDTYLLAQAQGLDWENHTAETLSPFRFAAPLSPHLAAAQEGRSISTAALLDFCRHALSHSPDTPLLIEGAGGVLAPINTGLLTADWIAALHLPAIVVVGSYLGSISHSLTAIEALSHRAIPLYGLIVSESAGSPVTLADTVSSLQQFSGLTCPILALPRHAENVTITHPLPDLTMVIR